jgi:hypothetical protein
MLLSLFWANVIEMGNSKSDARIEGEGCCLESSLLVINSLMITEADQHQRSRLMTRVEVMEVYESGMGLKERVRES